MEADPNHKKNKIEDMTFESVDDMKMQIMGMKMKIREQNEKIENLEALSMGEESVKTLLSKKDEKISELKCHVKRYKGQVEYMEKKKQEAWSATHSRFVTEEGGDYDCQVILIDKKGNEKNLQAVFEDLNDMLDEKDKELQSLKSDDKSVKRRSKRQKTKK